MGAGAIDVGEYGGVGSEHRGSPAKGLGVRRALILAHGESIRDFDPVWVNGGYVFAVNRAIEDFSRIADAWVFNDFCSQNWDRLPARHKSGLRVLVRPRDVKEARKIYEGHRVRVEGSRFYDTQRFVRGVQTPGPVVGVATVPTAIMTAMMEGFEHIDLYGVDMKGSGSGLDEDYSEEEGEAERMRWAMERAQVAKLCELAPSYGAKVSFSPQPVGF